MSKTLELSRKYGKFWQAGEILTDNKNRYLAENKAYQKEAMKRVNFNPVRVLIWMPGSV